MRCDMMDELGVPQEEEEEEEEEEEDDVVVVVVDNKVAFLMQACQVLCDNAHFLQSSPS
jgi:hypothetical protein